MKRLTTIFILLSLALCVSAQTKMKLSLDDALVLARTQSLQSFLIKNNYLSSYWQHKNFKANYLPSLSLNSKLISYSNASQLRYNSLSQSDMFVRTQNLSSGLSLALVQNVALTGGTFFIESKLNRNQNFGGAGFTQFSSVPYRIGYRQDLFGYNQFKWERKIEPRKYEQAVKQYLNDVEQINSQGCYYFFGLAISGIDLEMIEYNYHNTDTLLQVAKKRFQLGTIQKEELLELELSLNNASIRMEESRIQFRKSKEAFISFFRIPNQSDVEIILPKVMDITLPVDKAVDLAMKRNADVLRQNISLLESESQLAQVKAKNRFQVNLNVSYGINKSDGAYDNSAGHAINGKIGNVYQPDFDKYEQVGLGISIPILDWGKRKGQFQIAKSQQEIMRIKVEQTINSFRQDLITKVLEFNLQYNKVQLAAKSDSLAMDGYELTSTRFKRGNIDVLKLTSSQISKDNAKLKYIQSLRQYWSDYYMMRKLTLYDFRTHKTLEEDFENLLNEYGR